MDRSLTVTRKYKHRGQMTMTKISYPSEQFPNPVPFFLDAPDTWEGVHVPHTLVAVRGPEPVAGFRPNVLVSWQRIAADGKIERLGRKLVEDSSRSYARFTVEAADDGEVEGLPVFGMRASVVDDDGLTLQQKHLLVAGPETSATSRDLFHVSGTFHVDDDRGAEAVTAIIRSFVVIDPASLLPTDRGLTPSA